MSVRDAHESPDDHRITPDDVKVIARRVFGDDPSFEILSYDLAPFSQQLLGVTGTHEQLKITVQKKDSESPASASLFVKTIPHETKLLLDLAIKAGLFFEEAHYFDKVFPRLTKHFTGQKWSPMCYFVKNSSSIVLEDLRSQGYKVRRKIFDDAALLKSALATVARFHGCSILAEWELKRQASQNRATLKDCYPNDLKEKQFCSKSEASKLWLSAGARSTAAVAEKIGLGPELVHKAFERATELVKTSLKYRNVICHGDLWANNIMFDDTEPTPKSVLVDFQMIKYAPMVLDVLQFLYLNTTRPYREKHDTELIELYHEVLEETIGSSSDGGEVEVPSLAETLEAYEDLRLFGAVTANTHLPVVLLNQETAKQLEKDPTGIVNLLFHKRDEIVLEAMEKDDSYRDMNIEIVTELIELGRKYFDAQHAANN